jgi:hypothetical protein
MYKGRKGEIRERKQRKKFGERKERYSKRFGREVDN